MARGGDVGSFIVKQIQKYQEVERNTMETRWKEAGGTDTIVVGFNADEMLEGRHEERKGAAIGSQGMGAVGTV